MQEKIIIQDREIGLGESAEVLVKIARLPTHTEIDMPVYVFRGKEPGPSLLLTASMHGDEVNGTETLRRMIRKNLLTPDRGTVIAMPIVNVFGFIHQSRALPDGKDLNRSFPGSKAGSLARRLAYTLMNEVIPHVTYGIDLHTGGARRTNFPQIRCDFSREESVRMAHAFGAPFTLNSTEIDGSFRKAACDEGKTIIVFEGGESQRIDELSILEGMDGILRVMNHLDMTGHSVSTRSTTVLADSSWVRAKIAGVFVPTVHSGAEVKKGEIIAHIGDPYGDMVEEVLAPRSGYVIGLNNHPIVHAGDALIHIGWLPKDGEELHPSDWKGADPDADYDVADEWMGFGGS
jgi:predicted deacylase